MSRRLLSYPVLLTAAVVAIAVAVGIASTVQRRTTEQSLARSATGNAMLVAMLDQETGVRGYLLTGRTSFLEPYRVGQRNYIGALRRGLDQAAGDPQAHAALRLQDAAARVWQSLAYDSVTDVAREGTRFARAADLTGAADDTGPADGTAQADGTGGIDRSPMDTAVDGDEERKVTMDRFRAANADYQDAIALARGRAEERVTMITVGLVLVLFVLFAGAWRLLARRGSRLAAEAAAESASYVAAQEELNQGLQVSESEGEAHGMLQRYIEHAIPGAAVTVLKRDPSGNRLHAGTPLAPDSPLRGGLVDAAPRSCLAVRTAHARTNKPAHGDVLRCDLCRDLGRTTCTPLRVGGEVIGSVLVDHEEPLDQHGARAVEESVIQAAPVLANLRNLAMAEDRAATDGLTGLPNRRALDDSLRRMVAQSGRAMSPMAVAVLDLDHFKRINDQHGHAVGDDVLRAVGAALQVVLRDSDFVARAGGEEFALLLPDTGRDGAAVIGEKVRTALADLQIPTLPTGITGSIGVAVMPDDASDGESLMRVADRMLYEAKDAGRNCVRLTTLELGELPPFVSTVSGVSRPADAIEKGR